MGKICILYRKVISYKYFLSIRKKGLPTVPAEHARNMNKQFREKRRQMTLNLVQERQIQMQITLRYCFSSIKN